MSDYRYDCLCEGRLLSRETNFPNARAFALGFGPECEIREVVMDDENPPPATNEAKDKR